MSNQRRPLLDAALHGDLPRFQEALAAGADPASESASVGGLGPLHAAAASGLAAAVPLLVAAGADVNGRLQDVAACSDVLSGGPTLTRDGLIEVLRTAGMGITPLHVAAALGKPAVVQALLDAGGLAMRLGSQCSAHHAGKAVPWNALLACSALLRVLTTVCAPAILQVLTSIQKRTG